MIEMRGVGKCYRVGLPRADTLRDRIAAGLRGPMGRTREFWALRDLNLEVPRGEILGIVGANGAGKSTLLKILSRITEPSEGEVVLRGKVASLLEVGAGFHPELTGRENIFLNGILLGMKRSEVAAKFDAIVDFSGVEKFLDTPVKRYSSGMYVRLAFSVAAHLDPEVLIVDEVLAVGDAEFQRKCLGRMEAVAADEGRTVLFVSHNMAMIERLCRKAVLLEGGRIASCGTPGEVIRRFLPGGEGSGEHRFHREAPAGQPLAITSLEICGQPQTWRPLRVRIELQCSAAEEFSFDVSVTFRAWSGAELAQVFSNHSGTSFTARPGANRIEFEAESLPLAPGDYLCSVWAGRGTTTFDLHRNLLRLRVGAGLDLAGGGLPQLSGFPVLLPAAWRGDESS